MGLEIISLLKKKLGLTTQQLSEMSGVPVGTLNKILNGTTLDPKLETLKALAKVLGCSLDDFDDKKQTNKQKIMISTFEKLNDIGKNEAIKRVEELTYINKYIKNDEMCAMVAEEKEVYSTSTCHNDNKEKLNIIREGIKNNKKASEILGDAFDNVAAHGDDLTDEEMEQMCNMVLEDIIKELE